VIVGLEFPSIENLVEWPEWIEGSGFNKIALIDTIALLATMAIFWFGAAKGALIPKGIQQFAEGSVNFIHTQIIHPTIGEDKKALSWSPLMLSLFFFIFFTNIFEIMPVIQMPANARMANPLVLALIVWVTFIAVGIKHQGFFAYFKGVLFPPGVPKALYILVTPIEFLSTFIVRPFSHAVRLFANMLAGHILLVTFGVLCIALFSATALFLVLALTFPLLVALTAFEAFVALLQAYIFTILAGVYIGGALHPEH
jgi:F-type H+-transporting ATPase subunit a